MEDFLSNVNSVWEFMNLDLSFGWFTFNTQSMFLFVFGFSLIIWVLSIILRW